MDTAVLVRLTILASGGLAVVGLLLWAWCYRPSYNTPIGARSGQPDVRPVGRAERQTPPSQGDSLVWVALSGGGTRAAALGWKVLEMLADTDFPVTRNGTTRLSKLGDEIDFISGTSGGSFAAVAWCLRQRPELFRRRFLRANIEAAILRRLMSPPWRALRLLSPEYDRINVAAELYDEVIFDGKTFADLAPRPQLLIHATHLALGARFSFTPEEFALLGSDLGSYPIGYACAACSAFPVLLSPLTLLNHGPRLTHEELAYIDRMYRMGLINRDVDHEWYLTAKRREFYNDKENRYVHLADGGLVDNQGLQAMLEGFDTDGFIERRLNDPCADPLKRLILINVNAGTEPDDATGTRRRSPGVKSVLQYTGSSSMDILSRKRWKAIEDDCQGRYRRITARAVARSAVLELEHPYTIEISFRNLRDHTLRRNCQSIPTSFRLSTQQLGWIDEAAHQLLNENQDFLRLQSAIDRQLKGDT